MNKYIVYACWIGVLGGLIFTVFCPSSPVYGWLNKGRYIDNSDGLISDTATGNVYTLSRIGIRKRITAYKPPRGTPEHLFQELLNSKDD